MNGNKTSFTAALKRMAESGYTVAFQSIYYTILLFIFFALIFDFGNVGYAYTVTSNAARLAAQDAAKNIDPEAFINDQEIRLGANAIERAQELVSGMTDGKLQVTELTISRLDRRDVIIVRAMSYASLPVLSSLFGMQPVPIPVSAYAEPAYGISEEGQ